MTSRWQLFVLTIILVSLPTIQSREVKASMLGALGRHHMQRSNCDSAHVNLTEMALLQQSEALARFVKEIPSVFQTGTWLQIGANTLDQYEAHSGANDPLLEYFSLYNAYKKILVEPMPFNFELLKVNTAQMENVECVQAAIVPEGTSKKTVDMYCPQKEDFWDKDRGGQSPVCSLDPEFPKPWSSKIEKYEVSALTMSQLFKQYNVRNVRVFMIDTEGYDFALLKMLPFQDPEFRPELIVYEHRFTTPEERAQAQDLLHAHCYALIADAENEFGLRLA